MDPPGDRLDLEELDRWLSERGARLATRSTAEVLVEASKLGPPDPKNPHPASDALGELRGGDR
jgi:hypothetical protein